MAAVKTPEQPGSERQAGGIKDGIVHRQNQGDT